MRVAPDVRRKELFEKQIAWIATLLFAVVGFPLLKKIFVFVLVKLYEFFFQQTFA